MSHEEHKMGTKEKLVYMANQIATFFESKPHDEGVAGVAKHINDFWDPRMRRQFFEMFDEGGKGMKPLVIDAAATIRRPRQDAA
ncbi:formate dehydrogenase delta subunit [Aminobacter aminovorans]|jgi:formate dehydrogenase subunit delta|uniref:NADH-dependant formate dehydrogenase delta subunit FdsD n=1 Tax=Aminobacter aminovorans TaxID=83263 RepID=A0A380WRK7_AMIAI|nr:formate dehydrogenase subunit delta [Aminobacter aminovorans]TCS23597.1 formate dehydrogenase delta subunit [Aminobacter aminovorans]SUU91563.1 NADH-dependant formate dehydrogenase delta subunit FdsD [Aminobacter aminovorans]